MNSQRIKYGRNPYHFFDERISYSAEVPYGVRIKDFREPEFQLGDFGPLHYGNTMELILFQEMKGEAIVGTNQFTIDGNMILYIAPYVLHSSRLQACKGKMYHLNLSYEALGNFLNASKILSFAECDIQNLPVLIDNFNSMLTALQCLIDEDENPFSRLRNILHILEILTNDSCTNTGPRNNTREFSSDEPGIDHLIKWTVQHSAENIRLEDAAAQMGYSKCYFCSYFKKVTGLSYLTYLNQVRIENAKRMLLHGMTVTQAGVSCGIENVSYFAKLFCKHTGYTPQQYQKLFQQDPLFFSPTKISSKY